MAAEALEVIISSPASDPDDGSFAKAFIAIADDNVVDRALTARLCMRLGCAVVCFTDGSHLAADFCTFVALGGSVTNYADIIICDYDMPGMRGDLTVKKLRKHGYQEPIVVVTSTSGVELACMEAGATQVLIKPFTNTMIKALLMIDEGKRKLLLRQLMPRCLSNATTRGASQHNFILMPPPSRADKRKHANEVKDLKESAAVSVDLYQHEVSDLILQVAATQEHLNVEKEAHALLRLEHAELRAAFARLQRCEGGTIDGSPNLGLGMVSPTEMIPGGISVSPEATDRDDSTRFHHVMRS
jgi:CheY-like chemotaxis protein